MNILAPSAKADGKGFLKSTKKYISVFLFSLPSASADGAEAFEQLNIVQFVSKSGETYPAF